MLKEAKMLLKMLLFFLFMNLNGSIFTIKEDVKIWIDLKI